MTDSIKPPGGPPSAPPAPEPVGGPEGGRFRGALERATPDAGAVERAASTARAASPELAAITTGLRDGSLTVEAALSRLVERHLGAGPARALTPVARGELERLLKARLEEDPTLRALSQELERAR